MDLCFDDESEIDMFIPPNDDDDTISDASFPSNVPTTTSPIILPTLPPITDTGLGDIN